MIAWKRIVILVSFIIWICTFIIGRTFEENSLYFKTPQPYYHPIENNITLKEKYKTPAKFDGDDGLKTILFYTPFFHMIDWQFGFGRQPFIDYGCPVTNCFTTNEPKMLGKIFLCYVLLKHELRLVINFACTCTHISHLDLLLHVSILSKDL